MTAWLRRRLAGDREAGLTLVELLVAAAMSVVIVGGATTMLISAVKTQPELSQRSQDISTARWVLERMTRELRNGIEVTSAGSSSVSFLAQVRHATCGSNTPLAASAPAIECQVTYACDTTGCSRSEAPPGSSGTPQPMFSGLQSANVFSYAPDSTDPEFVGVTLRFPNPDNEGALTISDGATLRNLRPFGS